MSGSRRAVAEGMIVERADGPWLIGARSKTDGAIRFPFPSGPQESEYEEILLPRQGSLWTYTVQRFRPKSPYAGGDDEGSYKPFALGYVELPGGIIVETRLLVKDFVDLRIGMPMKLALEIFRTEADGTQIFTYAFEPLL